MSNKLEIFVSEDESELRFRGNTFLFKEQIKSLGKAKWNPLAKEWIISEVSISGENLKLQFPDADIIKNLKSEETENSKSGKKKNSEHHKEVSNFPGALSVRELSSLVSLAISRQFPGNAKVFGRISSLKFIGSGRVYFDLVDIENSDTVLPCVIWERDVENVLKPLNEAGFQIENELPVLANATIRFNSKRAQLSLTISSFVPEYTVGKLLAERDATNKRLIAEGIYNKNRETLLGILPDKLAVITSKGGTVINDFMASLEVSEFGFNLFWLPVRVQGRDAVSEIIAAIDYFNNRKDIDAILIFRGGGSASELALFNKYEIAKKVCLTSKPVLSAIGHEHDLTSVQDVSYKSFGVPKDIGRFFSDLVIELRTKLRDNAQTILREGEKSFNEKRNNTFQLGDRVLSQSTNNQLKASHQLQVRTGEICSKMYSLLSIRKESLKKFDNITASSIRTLAEKERNLTAFESLLKAVSPEMQLNRGFALLKDPENGKYITSSKNILNNKSFKIEMKDGELTAKKSD